LHGVVKALIRYQQIFPSCPSGQINVSTNARAWSTIFIKNGPGISGESLESVILTISVASSKQVTRRS